MISKNSSSQQYDSICDALSLPFEVLLSKYRTEIMGVSMILIMFHHQSYISSGLVVDWIHLVGYIGVECFLLVSGLGVVHSLARNPTKQFYINRVKRLLPGCFIWGLSKCLLSLQPYFPTLEECWILEITSLSLWYIYASVVFYLISPLLNKFIEKTGWWALLFVTVFVFVTVAYLWNYNADAPYLLEKGRWVFKRLPVYVLGMLVVKNPFRIKTLWLFVIGAFLFLIYLILIRYIIVVNAAQSIEGTIQQMVYLLPGRHDIPDNGRFILDMLSVFFLCPFFALISIFLERIYINRFIVWCGAYSLGIYLCHQYLFRIFLQHSTGNPYLDLSCACLLSFAVAYLIQLASSYSFKLIQNGDNGAIKN